MPDQLLDWYIHGPSVVKVKGVGALADDTAHPQLFQLGLSLGPVRVIPNIIHEDMQADDYGPLPASVMAMGGDCMIHMTLVHFDEDVLHRCLRNSTGDYNALHNVPNDGDNPEALDEDLDPITDISRAGYLGGVGRDLGAGLQQFESRELGQFRRRDNLFISLSVVPAEAQYDPELVDPDAPLVREPRPYRFPFSYIAANPTEWDLGSNRSAVVLRWRAVPYRAPFRAEGMNARQSTSTVQELRSKGTRVWDRREDSED